MESHQFINWGWCGTFPELLHALSPQVSQQLASPLPSPSANTCRACSGGWWQVQPFSLFESLDTSAEQLPNYIKIQEFKGSGQNFLLFFFFFAPVPPLVNNLLTFFFHFSPNPICHTVKLLEQLKVSTF